MPTRRQLSEQDALSRLTARCAMAEYCRADMRRMMSRWELPEGSEERIMARLVAERYIDERRYAHAFVRDKFRYNRWGWTRIEQELRIRGIDADIISEAREEMDEEESLDTLRRLVERKLPAVKGPSAYDIRAKLLRFAMGRGFGYDEACKVIDEFITDNS